MSTRRRYLLVASFALATLWFAMPGFTGATYTASTGNTGTVTASPDWTPPTVAVTSPGSTISGTTTVAATASDASGIASVAIQYLASGGITWTTLCTDTVTPYSCPWDTTTVAGGGYSLRAVAIDKATPTPYTTTSSTVTTTVSNPPVVTMTDPGSPVSGNVAVSAAVTNYGSLTITSLKIQVTPTGTTAWIDVPGCSTTAATLSCSASTAGITARYDVRAIAVVGGTTYTDVVANVLIDNTAPAVTMTNPGSPLSGTATLAATASDADAGVDSVVISRAVANSSTWTVVCTDTTTPFSCPFVTTGLTDGYYDFRAVATDNAGNATTSATVQDIAVNNSTTSVVLADPGSYVFATKTLTATASSTNGVTKVSFQRAPSGSSTFTEICTPDTTSPYTCDWDPSTPWVANGDYDLRAVLTDNKGLTTVSAIQSTTVDKSVLQAQDIETVNKVGGTTGKIENGDKVVYTYSDQVKYATFKAGFTGTTTATATITRNTSTSSTLTVAGINLGSVAVSGAYVSSTLTIPVTVTANDTSIAGVTVTVVTLTLGTSTAGSVPSAAVTTPSQMIWTPSSAVTNPAGSPCLTTALTEPGTSDVDF